MTGVSLPSRSLSAADLGQGPVRFPARTQIEDGAVFRGRVKLPEHLALSAHDRAVLEPDEAHRGLGILHDSQILLRPGEEHMSAVGRDEAAVDVPSDLSIKQRTGLPVRVRLPELGPAFGFGMSF